MNKIIGILVSIDQISRLAARIPTV